MDGKLHTFRFKLLAGTGILALLATTPAYASYAYQGSDYSHTFSSGYASEACDKEADGNQVHNDMDLLDGRTYHAYDPNGSSAGCGTVGPYSSKVYRHRAVEYALGPDNTGPWTYGH